ncbi:unnamed protein product [Amoebophrya sp. A120]|nr:unnamed protein product [Amoebophrya sp. A120]|eukprot:GSA120T00001880001.1
MKSAQKEMDIAAADSGPFVEEGNSTRATRAATKQLATGLAELFAKVAYHDDLLLEGESFFQATSACLEASQAFRLFRADVRNEEMRRHMSFGLLKVKREAVEAIRMAACTTLLFCEVAELKTQAKEVDAKLQSLKALDNQSPGSNGLLDSVKRLAGRKKETLEDLSRKKDAIENTLTNLLSPSASQTPSVTSWAESSKLLEVRAAFNSAFLEDRDLLHKIPPFEGSRDDSTHFCSIL